MTPRCWSPAAQSVPKSGSTCRTSRRAATKPAGRLPSLDSGVPAAGASTAAPNATPRPATVGVSAKPTARLPTRSSISPSSTRSAPSWLVIPRVSPPGTMGLDTTSGSASGVALTSCERCVTRPSLPASLWSWLTSAARPPPAPTCRRQVSKPRGRNFSCLHCGFQGHRDLAGAHNIAAKHGGGVTSTPVLVTHHRAGHPPARRDRRRHLYDARRRSCLAPGRPVKAGSRSPGCHPVAFSSAAGMAHVGLTPRAGEDQSNVAS